LLGLGAVLAFSLRPGAAAEPAADLDPVLQKLGVLAGGRWVSPATNADGKPFAAVRWDWADDGRTLVGKGQIGAVKAEAWLGWDEAAKKVYYLDMHGKQTVYFGHVRLEGDELVYEFKSIVGKPATWLMRETYPDSKTCRAQVWQVVDGKPSANHHVINLKRADD
jgi:hypothetical protein